MSAQEVRTELVRLLRQALASLDAPAEPPTPPPTPPPPPEPPAPPPLPPPLPGSGVAELPRVRLDTKYVAPTGQTLRVPAGGDLQAALDAVQSGTVLLAPGATYAGNFVLPIGPGRVVIRTDTELPPEGTRVTPQTAAGFGKILTPNNEPAIQTANGARRWRIMGVEVSAAADVREVNGALVKLSGAREIILDRVYVHGHDNLDLRRGVELNAADSAVIDSWIDGCHAKGSDAQAILAYNTSGPLKINNNYLEGSGENMMFGGADSSAPENVPADIEFTGNDVVKPAAWFTSKAWTVKNLLEVKAGTRILIEGNTFDGCWLDGQSGHAFQLFSVNQDGTAPWSYASDLTFRRNVIRNVTNGATLSARYGPVGGVEDLARVVFEDNLWEMMGSESPYSNGAGGRLFQFLDGPRDVVVRHNTYAGLGLSNQVILETTIPMIGFVFEYNVIGPAEYGFQNAANLGTMAPGAVVRGNVLGPATWNTSLPAGNCIVWPAPQSACAGAGVR